MQTPYSVVQSSCFFQLSEYTIFFRSVPQKVECHVNCIKEDKEENKLWDRYLVLLKLLEINS